MNRTKLIRAVIAVVLGAIVIVVLGLTVFFVHKMRPQKPVGTSGGFTPIYTDHFSGEIPEVYPPLGIMIENHSVARPFQKGLSRAAVVYESPAEANITRFLAIFPAGIADTVNSGGNGNGGGGVNVFYPEKFGPVRSARVYFLDWMHEYNGVYVHVGGRYDALARLRKENIIDVDQFVYDAQFKRENIGRTALEHTMFTTGAALQKLIEGKNWIWDRVSHPLLERDGDAIKLPASADDAVGGANSSAAKKIKINFGHSSYEVNYEYDAEANRYKRSQRGVAHIDQLNGEQIAPEIVVIQRVNAWANNDSAGSIGMKTVDRGDAIIFVGGHRVEAIWKKESLDEPTRFFYKDGEQDGRGKREISFGTGRGAGPIWVEIVPLYNSVSYE